MCSTGKRSLKSSSFLILASAFTVLVTGAVGCNKTNTQDNTAQTQPAAAQPDQSQDAAASANLAPASEAQPASSSQYQSYPQDQNYSNDDYDSDNEDSSYGQPQLAEADAPPPLPEYSQPDCPGDGYLWTPGYWSYGSGGYYWVPGAWVQPPEAGLLWTPGYWGYSGGRYRYHYGFWGHHIGYYGGINYGFGYAGTGYQGGYWSGDRFHYNRAANNITNVNVTVYNRVVTNTVINNTTTNRVSYNGGTGGVSARASSAELAAEHEHHVAPTSMQTQHEHSASTNRALLASENHGRPAIAATARPGEFSGHGVVAAHESSHAGSPNGGGGHPNNAADLHKADRPPSHTPSNGGASNVSHANGGAPHTNNTGTSHTSTANTSHVNNGANNPPKNQPHPQNKPQTESKPHSEGKPH